MKSAVRRVQRDDLRARKRWKVYSWRFSVLPLLKRKKKFISVALARALAGDTKWEESDRKEKSVLMNAIG